MKPRSRIVLIVGAYPDSLASSCNKTSPISELSEILSEFLPSEICLHLLPFYPSSGDFGFAPNTLRKVKSDLGNWSDIGSLAQKRKVIVDGIYNHVGIEHEWVKSFLEKPSIISNVLFAYKGLQPNQGPLSPRGDFALREYYIEDECWCLWQTFSEAAADVRLDSVIAQKEIKNHLEVLASHGVWGVRLDALVYYAKKLDGDIRHNPGVYEKAEMVADWVYEAGLNPIAQLDCDAMGVTYFAEGKYKQIPINDFSFSTILALAFIEGSAKGLEHHLKLNTKLQRVVTLAPRTHDGILLRSEKLSDVDKAQIIKFAQQENLKVRISNGTPYELNCSAPYLYSKAVGVDNAYRAIVIALSVASFGGGHAYFYLPFLVGYIPEYSAEVQDEDPRALNRSKIPIQHIKDFLKSKEGDLLADLLNVLCLVNTDNGVSHPKEIQSGKDIDSGLLVIEDKTCMLKLYVNFSNFVSTAIGVCEKEAIFSNGLTENGVLKPLSVAIVKSDEER